MLNGGVLKFAMFYHLVSIVQKLSKYIMFDYDIPN